MSDELKNGSTKPIRALDRGLGVVELLSRRGQMSLADLRKATGLSNPTLLRLLLTLRNRGWVRRSLVEGRYELSHSLGKILGDTARAHPLAEIASPILLDIKGRQVGWPSDLCALMGAGAIEIVESTRVRGPMALTRTSLGIRPSMVLSAHGRVIMAFSNDEQRRRHLDAIRGAGSREDVLWIDSGRYEDEIARTRARGFGVREPGYWQAPFDPGPEHAAMAVPIRSNAGVHGSVSLLWVAEEMSLEDVLALGALEDLQMASARIGAALDKAGIETPDL